MFYTQESALTYDDVLIVPNYSEVLPTEVELKTRFSKNIQMNIYKLMNQMQLKSLILKLLMPTDLEKTYLDKK
jgi:hypothetical protein